MSQYDLTKPAGDCKLGIGNGAPLVKRLSKPALTPPQPAGTISDDHNPSKFDPDEAEARLERKLHLK